MRHSCIHDDNHIPAALKGESEKHIPMVLFHLETVDHHLETVKLHTFSFTSICCDKLHK